MKPQYLHPNISTLSLRLGFITPDDPNNDVGAFSISRIAASADQKICGEIKIERGLIIM
jgi:hypothetical protein